MDSCALIQYRPRRSFEKPHVEAPLQVIGFNLSPKEETIKANGGFDDLLPDSEIISRATEGSTSPSHRGASSPRSALQQLLLKPLNQSQPASSSPSANPNLTHGLLKPSSPPSANQRLTGRLLLTHPSASCSSSANQTCTSGIFKSVGQSQCASSPGAPSASRSSGLLKTLLQSEGATSDGLANQDSCTSFLRPLRQSQGGRSSSSANQRLTCVEGEDECDQQESDNSKPSKLEREDNYAAFFQIKPSNHEACLIRDEIKGRLGADGVIKEGIDHEQYSCVGKSIRSSCKEVQQVDEQQPTCARISQKSSWVIMEQVQIDEHHAYYDRKSKKSGWKEVTNPEKSKKSSLFMFVVSSPAAEYHHQDHHHHLSAERNMDFLNSCHLCRRLLGHGKDVFMYSGDKAFCSMECRYQQIVIDERNERRTPPVIRAGAFTTMTAVTSTSATHNPIMINKPHFINNTATAA